MTKFNVFYQIEKANTQAEYDDAITASTEWCAERGLAVYAYRNIEDKEKVLKILIMNEIIYRYDWLIGNNVYCPV